MKTKMKTEMKTKMKTRLTAVENYPSEETSLSGRRNVVESNALKLVTSAIAKVTPYAPRIKNVKFHGLRVGHDWAILDSVEGNFSYSGKHNKASGRFVWIDGDLTLEFDEKGGSTEKASK